MATVRRSKVGLFTARQRKLWEGNVISRVCLSFCSWREWSCTGPCPSLCTGPQLPTSWHIRGSQPPWTCSNLGTHCTSPPHHICSKIFDLDLIVHGPCPIPPPTDMFKLVRYEARLVTKRAVGIRLKCLPVLHISLCRWNMDGGSEVTVRY